MKALLIVDLQNDFCPGGALPVKDGDKVVPAVNRLMGFFPIVVASQDWHPPDTGHFGKWPVHCVRDTNGADLHPGLKKEKIAQVFRKGTGNNDDGYSAFEATNLDLEKYLKDQEVDTLCVVGLATDYCVKATALDAVKKGFKTFVVAEAVAAVNVSEGDGEKALKEMQQTGVLIARSTNIP